MLLGKYHVIMRNKDPKRGSGYKMTEKWVEGAASFHDAEQQAIKAWEREGWTDFYVFVDQVKETTTRTILEG